MRSRFMLAMAVAGIGALTLISSGGADSEKGAAPEDIFRSVDVRLDHRCQVAVFDMSLTRDAPLGLRLVGRVPFGGHRRPAKADVQLTEVWDLVYSDGSFLKPGTHHGKVRAFADANRAQVIDTFPVTLRIPKSFYERSLDRCGQ